MLTEPEKIAAISRHTTMDVVMAENPQTIPLLLKYKMHCVGCFLAPFHTVEDAAFEHDLDEDTLLENLQNVQTKVPA